MTAALIEKFTARTRPDGDCLIWTGARAGRYGAFYAGGGRIVGNHYAHRWIVEQTHGPIPPGAVVMHACDRPLCVAIAHLSVGTHSQNHQDAFDKGRRHRRGSVRCGDRFGRWIVVAQAANRPKRGTAWLCRCDCGNEKVVGGRFLRIGKSQSCGCFMREKNGALLAERSRRSRQ